VTLRMTVLIGALAVLLATGSKSFAGEAVAPAVMAAFEARFDLIDANKDGKVTREEFVKFHTKQAENRFDALDKNKKGYLTREEAQQLVEETGAKMQEKRKRWMEKKQQMQQQKQQQQQQQ